MFIVNLQICEDLIAYKELFSCAFFCFIYVIQNKIIVSNEQTKFHITASSYSDVIAWSKIFE